MTKNLEDKSTSKMFEFYMEIFVQVFTYDDYAAVDKRIYGSFMLIL